MRCHRDDVGMVVKGGLVRTCKLGFYALAHEPKLYVIQCPENIGGHDGLFVLQRRDFVGPVARKHHALVSLGLVAVGAGIVRIREVVDEHCCALGHGQDGIGLDLGVWRKNTLSETGNYGLW